MNKEPLKISMLKIHSPDGSGAQLISVMHIRFPLKKKKGTRKTFQEKNLHFGKKV